MGRNGSIKGLYIGAEDRQYTIGEKGVTAITSHVFDGKTGFERAYGIIVQGRDVKYVRECDCIVIFEIN